MKGDDLIKLDDYEKILIGFAREIVSYLQKSGASKAEAEDVVQDVFVKMLESDFIIPAEKMKSWMYQASIRRYIDRYRRGKRYWEILQQDFFAEKMNHLFANDDYELLYSAIQELSEKDALLLELYYFQGFTIKEIAQITAFSISKVKIQLMRSRTTLRSILEKKGLKNGDI